MADPVTLAAFGLAFFVVVLGQTTMTTTTTKCPDFVPADADTSAIAGEWFLTQTLTVGYTLPNNKCERKTLNVNSGGTVTAKVTMVNSENKELHVDVTGTPVDNVRTRLSYVSSAKSDNADIYTILKIVPNDYYINVFCSTVDGQLGYKVNIYSRKNNLNDDTVASIKKFLDDCKLSSDLVNVDQTNCPPD